MRYVQLCCWEVDSLVKKCSKFVTVLLSCGWNLTRGVCKGTYRNCRLGCVVQVVHVFSWVRGTVDMAGRTLLTTLEPDSEREQGRVPAFSSFSFY